MRKLCYLAAWFIKAKFFQQKQPLQTVLFITDRCNLACKHCTIYKKENPTVKTYEQIKEELNYSYRKGSRFVDFEGGEPTIWRDKEYDINSLIQLAKQIGFFSVTVTTNALLPFANIAADSLWVSLDGIGNYHDDIRGPGAFAKLEKNISTCGHPRLSVNMVINNRNYESVEQTIEFARDNPYIRSISINFHTPYSTTEHLFLDWKTRQEVIDKIILMKRKNYPILNSISGLKLMRTNNFEKQCWISNFIMADGARLDVCQGQIAGICDQCGYSMAGEMKSLFDIRLDTVLAGLKLRVRA